MNISKQFEIEITLNEISRVHNDIYTYISCLEISKDTVLTRVLVKHVSHKYYLGMSQKNTPSIFSRINKCFDPLPNIVSYVHDSLILMNIICSTLCYGVTISSHYTNNSVFLLCFYEFIFIQFAVNANKTK